MRSLRFEVLLLLLVASAAVADRVSVVAASSAKAVCLDVVAGAPAASGPEDSAPGTWVFQQCQRLRPAADHECGEFVQLYQTARHYSQDKFSADDFCSTVQAASASAQKLSDHEVCVAGVDGAIEALGDKTVADAAVAACMRAHPRVATTPDACQRYVAAVIAAPKDGLLDTARLCERLLSTSASAGNGAAAAAVSGGSGSGGIDEDHFVTPCVQFAANAVATGASGGDVAAQVQQTCEAHLSNGDQSFCTGYAALVRRSAARSELSDFCTAQFQKMTAAPQPVTAAATMKSAAASSAAQPVATAHATSPAVTQDACEQYLRGVMALGLPKDEVAKVVRMDCPSHLGASPLACANVERLVATGDVPGACKAGLTVEAAHGASGPDLSAACVRTVEKVALAGLHDAALSRAAAGVCAQEVTAQLGGQQQQQQQQQQQPKPGLKAGCEFLASRLVAASSEQDGGVVNAAAFCASLKGGETKPQTPLSTPVLASPVPVEALPAADSPRSQLRGASVAAATDGLAGNAGNADFLSAFLDHYDDGKQARAEETWRKAHELFGSQDNAGLPPLPTAAPLPRLPLGDKGAAGLTPVNEDGDNTVALAPRRAGPRPRANVQLQLDSVPPAPARPTMQAEPRNDIDSLVSSFVLQQAY